MPTRLVCAQGHRWEVPTDPEGRTADWPKACPVCGVGELSLVQGDADSFSSSSPGEVTQANTPQPIGAATIGASPVAAPAAPDLQLPGFEILSELGRGGMGVVYRARQTKLERLVAVKVLPAEFSRDPTFAERFTREAEALAKLSHPHIITIFDFGQHQDQSYFVMELIEGHNLRQRMRHGPMPPRDAVTLIAHICDALHYAHDSGLVHRDIKPENILLDQRGRLKIADFGLARLLTGPRQDYTLTGPMQVLGTWHYMAPEQLDNPLALDHRADLYAVGVMLYELLTGERPVGRFELPSHKAAVDARMDEIVLKALQKDPQRRYQSAAEMKAALDGLVLEQAAGVPTASPLPASLPQAVPISAASALTDQATMALGRTNAGPSNLDHLRAAAALQVKGPAIGLLVTGILAVLIALIFLLSGGTLGGADMDWEGPRSWWTGRWLFCPGVLGLFQGIMLIVCAIRMLHVESYTLAKTGGMLALAPLSPAWLLGLPMGIWALTVLNKPEVRAAFPGQDLAGITMPTPRPQSAGQDTLPGGSTPPTEKHQPGWFGRVFGTSYGWTLLVCLAGVFFVLAPWAEVRVLTNPGYTHGNVLATVHGYHGGFGWAPAIIFLALFWIFFVAGGNEYTPLWRPFLSLASALIILIVSIMALNGAGSAWVDYSKDEGRKAEGKKNGGGMVEEKIAFRGSFEVRVFPNLGGGRYIAVTFSGHATKSGASVEFDTGQRRWTIQVPDLTNDRVYSGRADTEPIRRRLHVSAEAGLYCTLILSALLLLISTLQFRGIVQGRGAR